MVIAALVIAVPCTTCAVLECLLLAAGWLPRLAGTDASQQGRHPLVCQEEYILSHRVLPAGLRLGALLARALATGYMTTLAFDA